MPVNGIELKEGQIWCTRNDHAVELYKSEESIFPWVGVDHYSKQRTFYRDNGTWHQNDQYETARDLVKLIKDVPMKSTNKFNPQPGDKIICNNGEEFTCYTLETLVSKGFGIYFKSEPDSVIFGMKEGYSEWMYWHNEGYTNDPEWNIREVIPQNTETPADKKEEVQEEHRYSLQEIKEAWDASGWVISTSAWEVFQKNLTKISSPEYQEYLRLRAIYE